MGKITDVVIPVYKPDKRLVSIVEILEKQTERPRQITVINTGADGWERFVSENGFDQNAHKLLKVIHIKKNEFDHGGTRNLGAGMAEGADYCLFMTQDALPRDEFLIEKLLAPMEGDPMIAAGYARQLPNEQSGIAERISRDFNYPPVSRIKTEKDFDELGIKTYFCSNVCAAYNMAIFEKLGHFVDRTVFNEDMIYAGKALKAGYKIAYCAEAMVYHSHDYGAMEQFHRNFDLGVSQAEHPEIFAAASSEGEGSRYVKAVIKGMKEEGQVLKIPEFIWRCCWRLLGYKLGKNYTKLPRSMCYRFASNKEYFR